MCVKSKNQEYMSVMADPPPTENKQKPRYLVSKTAMHDGKQVVLLSLPAGIKAGAFLKQQVATPAVASAPAPASLQISPEASTSTDSSSGKLPSKILILDSSEDDSDDIVEIKKPRKTESKSPKPLGVKTENTTPKTKNAAKKEKGPAVKKEKKPAVKKEKEGAGDRISWSHESKLKLIEFFGEKKVEFTSGNQSMLWFPMAEELSRDSKQNITAAHCRNKWCELKSVYKLEVDRRKTSGEGSQPPVSRQDFVESYFDLLHEILFDVPEVNPKCTVSTDDDAKKIGSDGNKTPKTKYAALANFNQARLEMKERHHKEKMEALMEIQRQGASIAARIAGGNAVPLKSKQDEQQAKQDEQQAKQDEQESISVLAQLEQDMEENDKLIQSLETSI